jgi:hypothetical protein
MKMKQILCLSILLATTVGHGQNTPVAEQDNRSREDDQNRNQGNRRSPTQGDRCETALSAAKSSAATVPSPVPNPYTSDENVISCIALARVGLGSLAATPQNYATLDKRIVCTNVATYTLDYKACTSAANAYNYILGLEKAMLTAQEARVNQNGQKLATEVTNRQMQGDGQNAALEASTSDNNFKSNLSMEQAYAYGAAVAVLSQQIASWPSSSTKSLVDACKKGQPQTGKLVPATQLASLKPCGSEDAPRLKGYESEIYANGNAKSALTTAAMEYAAKAAAALIAAKKFKAVAEQTAAVAATTPTKNGTALGACVINPMAAGCATPGGRVVDAGLAAGDFNMGEGAGNNNFGNGTGTDDGSIVGNPTNVNGDNVADLASPFENNNPGCTNNPNASDASKASCILNPSAAAKVQPTGGAGGGGGGAGGGMGGGGVSLDGTQGEDTNNKAADIKAGNANGNYAAAGGGGFQGIKGGKDDANPFASMFDNKSEGGVEEDRSIASIEGKDSDLFARISKRYTEVQAAKRVEANNQE